MSDGPADLAYVLGVLGRHSPAATPPDLGSRDRTHVYRVDDIVVKCDDRHGSNAMVRERCALELLTESDMAVPRVVSHGDLPDGRRWIVLQRLPGHVPDDASRLAHEISEGLAAQLGSVAAQLHRTVTPGFGTWHLKADQTMEGEARGRIAALTRMAEDAEIVPMPEVNRVVELLVDTIDAAARLDRPVLAHRDIQARNVLVDGTRLTALLDFESAAGGDPAEDFKVIGLDWTTPSYAAFCRAYADAGGALGADGPERVAHHVLNWVLVVFAYLGRIAPDYLAPARAALERIATGERPVAP